MPFPDPRKILSNLAGSAGTATPGAPPADPAVADPNAAPLPDYVKQAVAAQLAAQAANTPSAPPPGVTIPPGVAPFPLLPGQTLPRRYQVLGQGAVTPGVPPLGQFSQKPGLP